MKKQTGYKYHIEQALIKNNWEIVETTIPEQNIWESESWIVKTTHNPEINLYFSFNKPWQYEFSEVTISDMNASEYTRITSVYLSKGRFNKGLQKCMTDLTTFRNTVTHQKVIV
ncbi:hypothetical protein [uncultured Dokdonia sp.]|uniref:hypothetical protein n=1 Tax=uncultured Dokdonia sp. TaxID=575653 RepID=UPI002604CD9C|nr:hypothetical protein [uncultured Dokdonia sp.]